MRKRLQYTIAFTVLTITLVIAGTSSLHGNVSNYSNTEYQQPDTIRTTEKVNLKYKINDSSGNPLLENEEKGGINLNDPNNLDYKAEYNYNTGNVTIYRKMGNMDVRLPYSMPLEDYLDYDTRKSVLSYWRQKQQEEAEQYGENSAFNQMWKNVGGEAFEGIFGSNAINVRLQGMAELRVGIQYTKIDNPTLQERLRKTTTFDFQEKIQMNLSGSIGEKLKLGVNYNTEATFDFENQINLEYEGGEDDILKKVEAGNVTLPLPGTLITGSQSLFGVKTEMQFGKLTVTSIFSQQKGETSVMNIEGGAETQEFEIHADQYDRNRHFFLSEYFRDNYNQALERLPIINSPVNITRVEVWVTNNRSDVRESRNVVGFVDLGENAQHIYNPRWGGQLNVSPRNDANDLYYEMDEGAYNAVRDINQVTATLNGVIENVVEYEKLENARKLSDTEFSIQPKLGYISLNTSLNADEVLCVAYEYTYSGQTYKVGEFSNTQNEAEKTLLLKLLKGTNLSPGLPTWNLMMKNIYAINAYQVNRDDFIMNVTYTNDSTGGDINYLPEGPESVMGQLFIRLMNLDNLNTNNDYQPDGIFDYVENLTIKPDNGRIIFPVLEPFGSDLEKQLEGDNTLIKKYVFQSLYDSTQIIAEQDASVNKYKLKGRYKSSSGSEISLNAMNIPQGSVIVTAGGIKLVENQDYTVDYTLGRVRIINQGILSSGTPIQVSLENQSLFALQTKTLMGTHLDYQFNDNFNLGGTLMHLRERPLTQKVNIGDEPIANTIWGLNTSFYTESMGITEIIDKLPLVETKEMSSVTFEGEFAQLIPGHPKVIDESGTSYIDDFEGTRVPYDMRNWLAWQLASTPQDQTDLFPEANLIDDLKYGINRAKFAWYTIDPLFLRNNTQTPGHIKGDEEQTMNHMVREVYEQEIFPNREAPYGQPTNLPVLNIAYYPSERGPYNFDAGTGPTTDGYGHGINYDGTLKNPEERWGGMMRQIDVNDFEAANIEYIEFWMMDPYVYDENIDPNDGTIYFNLGNVSEDILRDARKSFENGLPGPGEPFDVDSTQWGYVSRKQNLVNGFSNDPATRLAQDVGLNGMNSDAERYFYRKQPYPFLDIIEQMGADLSEAAREKLMQDPASDDFLYFLGGVHDENETSILDRYKNFNSPEANSLPSEYEGDGTKRASKAQPDMEDINNDNTLSENESYFQYEVPISKNTMSVDANKYIVDSREGTVDDKNGVKANWFLFRIPIQQPDQTIGSIKDLRSVRFMRMFMRGFKDTTILRMATLDLIKGDWRKFNESLYEDGANTSNTEFEVSVVNIEESSQKTPVNYVLPPGIDRVIDPANPQLRELNEQSLLLKVQDLGGGDARAVYKNVSIDIRQYQRMKMFIHAEDIDSKGLLDNEMMAFVRVGSDYNDNYYEYEIPLKITPPAPGNGYDNDNIDDRYIVWPEENEMNIPLDLFQTVKLRRNDEKRVEGSEISFNQVYIMPDPSDPTKFVSVKGNPNLSNIRTITMGVRTRGSQSRSVEVWMNELRLTDFNEEGGWAANARMSVKLADLGNVSLAGKKSTVGWGSIDQNVQERSQEDFLQYDIATNLELGKLLGPESALSVPFYFGFSKSVASPKYYPLDPDIPLEVALDNAESEAARDSIKNMSQNVIKRKSVNFTNVKLMPKKDKVHFYSPSNISATYSYNETTKHDVDTDHSTDKNYRGILAYNYNARPKAVEPFKKSVKSNSLALVRDFNFYYLPNQISYRWEFDRQYRELQLRNNTGSTISPELTVSKDFDWNRYFDMRYNLTKSLKLNFKATTNARIDEPEGAVNKDYDRDAYYEWRDQVWRNIQSMGRTTTYQHNFDASYTIPINKLPLLDFTSANLQYRGMYQWVAQPLLESDTDAPEWGNTIRNSNVIQGNGQLNMTTLYKKVNYLNELDKKYRSSRRRTTNNKDGKRTVRFNKANVKLDKDEAIVINHKLKTEETSVRIFDATGKPVRGEVTPLGKNKVQFTPEKSVDNARVMVTGTVTENNSAIKKVVDYSVLLMTSLKNVSVSYSEQNGTILPGYTPKADFMGSSSGFTAPGLPFVLGWQDRNFASDAAKNGWLTEDESMVNPYVMTHGNDFSLKFTLEPIRGLRIDVNADRSYERNINEYYIGGKSTAEGRTANGRFSMSFNAFRTAFYKPERTGALTSETFDEFINNRQIILNRLDGDYNENSQEVLIPAFLAAYSGKSANYIFTEQFPGLSKIQPNWRLTYDGLSRVKAFKNVIKSFDLTHAYRSTYNMGAYISRTPELSDGPIIEYDINAITISEQFNPLIGVNITWTNSITTRAEIKKARTLSLSMGNNQVIENYNDEIVIGLGYRFDKMNLIFGKGSSQKSVSNDLNIRADFSIQDNISFIRKIQEEYNQLSAGQKITKVKFTADYALSDRFNMQLFYDTNINTPYVSLSYPITNSNFGVSFRFSLAQ
ncbi:cell surface protein SprA [Carboxylicivirga marina]|uniref:T9SS outer membrane translocon Sov/SprA n=1 Tax=Carboxylicivirga marina TaxID=2800988 RepID=UPI0025927667|nr:cell surface protein SprA [uncultured Carboxylicivirga sp.]